MTKEVNLSLLNARIKVGEYIKEIDEAIDDILLELREATKIPKEASIYLGDNQDQYWYPSNWTHWIYIHLGTSLKAKHYLAQIIESYKVCWQGQVIIVVKDGAEYRFSAINYPNIVFYNFFEAVAFSYIRQTIEEGDPL